MKKIFVGIKGKFLVSTMVVILATLFSLSGFSIYTIKKKSYDDYIENSREQLEIVAQAIRIFYEQIEENLNMLATNPVIMKADSSITSYKHAVMDTEMRSSTAGGIEQEIYEVLEQYGTHHGSTVYVYIGTEYGGYVQWPLETANAGYDPTKRIWYTEAKNKKGEIIRTDPYEYHSQLVVSCARTITDEKGNVIGAIGIDVNQSEISDMLKNMKTGETGFSMMVHRNGLILADGNNENNNLKYIEDVNIAGLEKLLDEESSTFAVTIGNVKYIVNSYDVDGTDWILASFITEDELESGARSIIITVAVVSIFILLAAFVISNYVTGGITKPVLAVTEKVKQYADLDFSPDEAGVVRKYLTRKDEIGDMVRSLKTMRDSVADFIGNASKAAEQIAASSEELTANCQQAASTSEEIASTVAEIAKGSGHQAEETGKTAANAEEMGNLLERNFQSLKELNLSAEEIERQKEEGFLILKELNDKTKKTNEAADTIYEMIMSNNESAEKIDKASSMIEEIASQTNLLSLNAAIEAARAGEVGRGFAVVAGEIRKLAEQSNKFAGDIKSVINELKERSHNAVHLMQLSREIITEQTASVEETEKKFDAIAEAIDAIKDKIKDLNRSAQIMTDNKTRVIELAQNLAAISQQNAASTQEVSAAAEEQAATIDEIAKAGEHLAAIAEDLRAFVGKFKT